jgi:hypothetical protein
MRIYVSLYEEVIVIRGEVLIQPLASKPSPPTRPAPIQTPTTRSKRLGKMPQGGWPAFNLWGACFTAVESVATGRARCLT